MSKSSQYPLVTGALFYFFQFDAKLIVHINLCVGECVSVFVCVFFFFILLNDTLVYYLFNKISKQIIALRMRNIVVSVLDQENTLKIIVWIFMPQKKNQKRRVFY